MKRFLIMVLALSVALLVSLDANAQSWRERKALFGSSVNYEVQTVGVGQDGTKFIKVWGFGKKVDRAIMQAKMNAVAACIFRGLPACESANATPAICKDPNAESTHAQYFEQFFEVGGKYLNFINMTTDGVPSGQDRLKVKGGYKVAIYVQVLYDNLRKQLEADGVVKKLSSGF